jgi:tRNA A-37 threonylcarbamoyl transferase component Bud32
MIGEQAGSYRIVDQIGEGGMGVVYAAEHVELGHRVAVKVLRKHFTENADIVQRFFNEARAATRVRHPGIVQIFDFGRLADGTVYFVMELLEGVSLGDVLENGLLPESYAAALGRQVAGALGAAHAVKIVHRDLKPDNIVIVRDPDVGLGERAKVLDFGIAKLVDMQASVSLRTQTGSVMGTPYYMSPEQSRGAGDIDHRSDIYSLGCILFEMVCGQPPFLSDGLGEVIGMHQFVAPPRPSALNAAVSDQLEAIILRTLEKKPDDRYQTMEELAQALTPLATGASGIVVPSGAIQSGHTGPIAIGAAGASMTARLADGAAPKVMTPPPAGARPPALATPPRGTATPAPPTDRRTVPLPGGARASSSRPKATGAVTTLRDATGESLTQRREPGELEPDELPTGKLRRNLWLAGVAALVAAGTAAAVVKLAGSDEAALPAAVAVLAADAGTADAEPALTRRDLGAMQAEFVLGEIERNQLRRQWRDVLELHARLPDDAAIRERAAPARDAARTGYLAEQIAATQRAIGEQRCADASALAEEAQQLLPDDADAARLGEIAAGCAAPAPDAGAVVVATPVAPTPTPARPPVRAPARPAVATAEAAEQALRAGDPRRALQIAETVLRRAPRDSRALTVAGLAACNAKNAAKARRYATLLGGQRADAMRSICQRNGIALPGSGSAALPETPSAAEVNKLLRGIQGRLAGCGADYRATSTVRVRIVIGGDGRVKEARADAAPKVAWCMEGAIRSVKFPASRKGMTVNYPVTLR